MGFRLLPTIRALSAVAFIPAKVIVLISPMFDLPAHTLSNNHLFGVELKSTKCSIDGALMSNRFEEKRRASMRSVAAWIFLNHESLYHQCRPEGES